MIEPNDHDAGMHSEPGTDEPTSPPDAAAADADRPVADTDDDAELTAPLEAPIETPVDDLIDQRRSVAFDDPDEH